jgi:hypothetical protein
VRNRPLTWDFLVGDTGIEPVTVTLDHLSPDLLLWPLTCEYSAQYRGSLLTTSGHVCTLIGHAVDTSKGAGMAGRRAFGQIQRLPSKRYRARYMGPDGVRHNAPRTFDARIDAEAWLSDERRLLTAGTWTSPSDRAAGVVRRQVLTLDTYAATWLADRPLKPRTVEHYASLIRHQLAPLADRPVASLGPAEIRAWHAALDSTKPTLRAHAYSLLRAILTTAVHDGLLPSNPCHIRGAGNAKRVHKIQPATLAELEALVTAMPVRYRTMTLMAAWCGLRFGELVELRRSDVDLKAGVIRVRRRRDAQVSRRHPGRSRPAAPGAVAARAHRRALSVRP